VACKLSLSNSMRFLFFASRPGRIIAQEGNNIVDSALTTVINEPKPHVVEPSTPPEYVAPEAFMLRESDPLVEIFVEVAFDPSALVRVVVLLRR